MNRLENGDQNGGDGGGVGENNNNLNNGNNEGNAVVHVIEEEGKKKKKKIRGGIHPRIQLMIQAGVRNRLTEFHIRKQRADERRLMREELRRRQVEEHAEARGVAVVDDPNREHFDIPEDIRREQNHHE